MFSPKLDFVPPGGQNHYCARENSVIYIQTITTLTRCFYAIILRKRG
jgi:hypothetical protein